MNNDNDQTKPVPALADETSVSNETGQLPGIGNTGQTITQSQKKDEITNNDGTVAETLDTAFHGKPGMNTEHPLSGSDRADDYEARSQGKSDGAEETDYLRQKNN